MISGTEASACETGQFCLASSAAWRNAGSSIPGTDRPDGERALRDPGSRDERHGRIDVELLGRRAGLREPVRERHREARCVRCRDELLGSRLAGGLARACVPAHGQRLERAAPDAIDRPASFQQRSRPGDVRCRVGHQLPPSRVASTVTVALALMSAENGQPASAASAAARERLGVGARHDGSRGDVGRDDPVTLALDLVHRDRAVHVHSLRRSACACELASERGDEAGRVRGGEELLGARLPLRDLDARGDRRPGARTIRCSRRVTTPDPARSRPLPVDLGLADDSRHG